jgi:hypothetical protein
MALRKKEASAELAVVEGLGVRDVLSESHEKLGKAPLEVGDREESATESEVLREDGENRASEKDAFGEGLFSRKAVQQVRDEEIYDRLRYKAVNDQPTNDRNENVVVRVV